MKLAKILRKDYPTYNFNYIQSDNLRILATLKSPLSPLPDGYFNRGMSLDDIFGYKSRQNPVYVRTGCQVRYSLAENAGQRL